MLTKIPLRVPDIGDADCIELADWYVSSGDWVEQGEELCELVTEKAAFPLEAPYKGKIGNIQKKAGSAVQVGETLLFLEAELPPQTE